MPEPFEKGEARLRIVREESSRDCGGGEGGGTRGGVHEGGGVNEGCVCERGVCV